MLTQYGIRHGRAGSILFAISLAAACLFSFLCPASPLTFKEAVEGMKARNESLMAAQDEIAQRDAERAAAKGLRLPKVELDLKRYQLNDPIELGTDLIGLGFIPYSLTVQNERFTKGEIEVTMPLYTGGRISAANHAAAARQTEARAQGSMTEEQLLTELAQRYYGLQLARRARDVQSLKAKAMADHAYRAKRLMEEGLVARVEYLNAKVAEANAQQELDAAERDIAIAAEGLANSIADSGAVEPSSPLFMIHELESCEAFQDCVTDEEHPVLKMLASKHDQAHQGVRAELGANLPTVYLFGMRELVPDDLTILDPKWAVGVGVSQTVFDGLQGYHKTKAAKALERKVEHLQQKVRRDLKSLVLKRYEELEKARSQFDAFDTTLDLTQENLRVRTRAFEEGLATSVEVVDAEVSHARAQLGRYKAAYDFDLALFQLLEASGRGSAYDAYVSKGSPVAEPAAPPVPVVESSAPNAESKLP